MKWKDDVAACVVIAAEDYPGSPRLGDEISGVDDAEALPGVVVFHAGTKVDGDRLFTAGGRVLSVTATGATLTDAIDLAYRGIRCVGIRGAHFRSDIGADTLAMREGSDG
jgi:phosphoribosylamine--glycine ligase